MLARIAVVVALAITVATAQQITSLPGLSHMPPYKMYSGYVSSTSPLLQSTHHTFHWIVESQGDPTKDPIVFWTNGGPGCSGLFGMGFENGPFVAQADGTLKLNSFSWNRFATMVFIEQPAGVGFSYSSNPADYQNYNDSVSSTDNAAFLSAFFAQYPQYQNVPLYLISESYGGNYIPQMTRVILEGNDNRLKAQLKGFAVGNPVFSIDDNATFANIMNAVQADILYGRSLLPLSFYSTFVEAGCNTFNPPSDPCDNLIQEMFNLAGACFQGNSCGDDMYNNPYGNATLGIAIEAAPDVDSLWGKWLNRADVQAAIHAKTPPFGQWADCANINYDITWPSNLPDYLAAFEAGVDVLIYSGDVDVATCPFASTQIGVEVLTELPGGNITKKWTQWTVLGQVAGYIEHHEKFAFATVKAAGHEAPGYQPFASYELISKFVGGKLHELTAPKPVAASARKLTQAAMLRKMMSKSKHLKF